MTWGSLTQRDGEDEAEGAELQGDKEQTRSGPGMVAYGWNASSWEAEVGGSLGSPMRPFF